MDPFFMMVRQILIVTLSVAWLCASSATAQPTDSLYQAWTNPALPDTQRLESLKTLINQRYLYADPDSTRLLAKEMYHFAEQKRLQRYMGLGLILESIVFQQTGPYAEGLPLAEKAANLYREAGYDKGLISAYTSTAILKEKMGDNRGALDHYQQTLAIAQRIKDQRSEALTLNNIGSTYSRLGEIGEAKTYIERGLALAQEMQNPAGLNQPYLNLGYLSQNSGDYVQAMAYFSRAAEGYKALGNLHRQAEIAYVMGSVHEQMGKYDSALLCVNQGLMLARQVKNVSLEAASLNMLGGINQRQGDYQEAIALLTQCLRIYDSLGYPTGLAATYGNLGNIYRDQRDFEKAKSYYERCRDLNDSIGDKRGVAISLSSLGDILADQGQDEAAMVEYTRSLQLAEEVQAQQEIAYAHQVIGRLYLKQGDFERAEPSCVQSLAMHEVTGNQVGLAGALNCLSSVAVEQQDYVQAIAYGERALGIARTVGIAGEVQQASFLLYQAYQATGQAGPALQMYEQYIQRRDSAESVENTRAILRERFQYEQDKKDALAKEELARQHLQRNALLVGLGLVGILAAVLFQNGRRRRRANALLSSQKAEIELKSGQNELLLKEIHHRVKNNLQSISSLLSLQSAHIKDAEVKQAVAAGQHRVEAMALIHQKLYQRDNLAAIEMKGYLADLVQSLIHTFDANPDRIDFRLDMPELELDVDTAVPLGLIVNELITNSLKYAFPDGRAGEITVSLRREGQQLELVVRDDGVGAANLKTGTSFGSKLIQLLTLQLGGQLEVSTDAGYQTQLRM
jgi:two-component sensor histidine kinase